MPTTLLPVEMASCQREAGAVMEMVVLVEVREPPVEAQAEPVGTDRVYKDNTEALLVSLSATEAWEEPIKHFQGIGTTVQTVALAEAAVQECTLTTRQLAVVVADIPVAAVQVAV